MNNATINRFALPMFIAGILAMVFSAFVFLGNPAFAAGAAGYKFQQVTLTYTSADFIFNNNSCGSVGSATISKPSVATVPFGIKNSDVWGKCKVVLTVLTK
jgi:hypothetical protein